MPLTVIVLLLLLAVGLVVVGVWYNRRQSQHQAQVNCQKAAEQIIQTYLADVPLNNIYVRWIDILEEQGYIEPLYARGSMMVLGAPGMGLPEVLKQIVRHTNSLIGEEHRMGVYLDAKQLTCVVELTGAEQSVENSFPEEIYRAIIIDTVNPFLQDLAERLGEEPFIKTGMRSLDIELKDQLATNIVDMPVAGIGQTLSQIWDMAGITQVRLCLDNAAAVRPEHQAVLLSLLLRTLEHNRQGDLVIGGKLDELQLMSSTPQGPVGIQFGHDIFLGVNLEALLLPQADAIGIEIEGGPRFDWLSAVLTEAGGAVSPEDFMSRLFDPPESWKQVFHAYEGDLERAAVLIAAAAAWKQNNPDGHLSFKALVDMTEF
jgi:hypothetical protein